MRGQHPPPAALERGPGKFVFICPLIIIRITRDTSQHSFVVVCTAATVQYCLAPRFFAVMGGRPVGAGVYMAALNTSLGSPLHSVR